MAGVQRTQGDERETELLATVLVVDDDPNLRRTARIILETNGYRVVEAENGRMALRVLKEKLPDVAVVDLVMPVLDGRDVLLQVRDNWDSAPPIIVMTGYASVDTVVELMKAGATDCLAKPFDEEDLMEKIERALGLESFDDEDDQQKPPVRLSRREIEVLLLMREGLTNKQIAERMSVGVRSVDEYVKRMCEKLRVKNRTSAVAWSYRHPMLDVLRSGNA